MYSSELIDLLSLPIPETRIKEESFLDIVGQPYRELAISNAYAYFLDQNRNKYIANLFVSSLLDLINKSNKKVDFRNFTCEKEVSTQDGKRIDLLIDFVDEKECIIIENKIFHALNNPLGDYLTIKNYPPDKITGVVLSLNKLSEIEIGNLAFISITHKDWMQNIKAKGLPTQISPKEFIYLSDFIYHMENLAESSEANEQVLFYFKFAEKVNKAVETQKATYSFLDKQLQKVADRLESKLYGSNYDWRHIRRKDSIFYAIEFKALFTSNPAINIIIQFHKDTIKREQEFRDLLSNDNCYKRLESLNNIRRSDTGWLHFVNKNYTLATSDIVRLSDFILERIDEDFKSVMAILLEKV